MDEKEIIEIPKFEDFIYNGETQQPNFDEKYTNIIKVIGTKQSAVGEYKATLMLMNTKKYQWEDGTTTPKIVTWRISKKKSPFLK